jgi:hypothetical protein
MENQDKLTQTETDNTAVNALIQVEYCKILAGKMFASAIGYLVVTLFLNWIRATASLWIVWPLIVIQLGLYLSIFLSGYRCFKVLSINGTLALVVFVGLAGLGRVIYLFDWEFVAIPLAVAIVIILMNVKACTSRQSHRK